MDKKGKIDGGGSFLKFFSEWNQAAPPSATKPGSGSAGPYNPVPQDSGKGNRTSDNTVIEMESIGDNRDDLSRGNRKERKKQVALVEWGCIQNIDAFLSSVYSYYYGKGFFSIIFNRICNLLIFAFVLLFALFLGYAVDWSFIHHPATSISHPSLVEVVKLSRIIWMPWYSWLFAIAFAGLWSWQLTRLIRDVPRLGEMHRFFHDLLDIKDTQLHATDFGDVIERIHELQREHPVGDYKLDAIDICNRIMRKENYLIALFNKNVLGLDSTALYDENDADVNTALDGSKQMVVEVTKLLEWNLSFCILNYVFDESFDVRKTFVKEVDRDRLVDGLNKRFLMMGVVNLVLSPFIFAYMLLYFFFRYGEELYRNPGSLSLRQYTTGARWKLREFNELPNYFERRLANSTRKASKYLAQFHNPRVTTLARFVSFVAGSFVAVLLAVTIANEDLLMHFEITPGKSAIWYLGFFGAVLAIARSLIPSDERSYDPSKLMTDVIEYTHYLPRHWRGQLANEQVRGEFAKIYGFRLSILLQELLGVVLTPFYLIFTASHKSEALIDFFREFTIHVDGLGYVCSFALFDFKRHGNTRYAAPSALAATSPTLVEKYQKTRQGKMEKSFISFVSNNPKWQPDENGSQFLGKLQDFEQSVMSTGKNVWDSMKASVISRKLANLTKRPSPLLESYRELEEIPAEKEGVEDDPDFFQRGLISILNKYYDQTQ